MMNVKLSGAMTAVAVVPWEELRGLIVGASMGYLIERARGNSTADFIVENSSKAKFSLKFINVNTAVPYGADHKEPEWEVEVTVTLVADA